MKKVLCAGRSPEALSSPEPCTQRSLILVIVYVPRDVPLGPVYVQVQSPTSVANADGIAIAAFTGAEVVPIASTATNAAPKSHRESVIMRPSLEIKRFGDRLPFPTKRKAA